MSTTAPTKFYLEDIVHKRDEPERLGVITRSYADEGELPPEEEEEELEDINVRRLQPGEVLVAYHSPPGHREILPEVDLVLVDRMYQLGDLCKRNIDDLQSGVVVQVETQAQLRHAISGRSVEGWWKLEDLEQDDDIGIGDYVVYNDWIGQVIEMFDESIVQASGGQLVQLPELSARLMVGDHGPDIMPPPGGIHNFLNMFVPTNTAHDTVLNVQHTVLAVTWLAINQSLEPADAASRTRPEKFWYGKKLNDLTLLRLRSDQVVRNGDRVRLKNESLYHSLIHPTRHGEHDPHGPIEVKACIVSDARISVNVLWQDGTVEKDVPSPQLIPYLNPGDSDAWPAVVQTVNAAERICKIRYTDDNTVEVASLLELDAYGIDDLSGPMSANHDGLGLRRGDIVLIHRAGTTNGGEKFRVPKLGEIEAWAREPPDLEDGRILGWRKEMENIGMHIAHMKDGPEAKGAVKRGASDPSLNWLGEVVDLRLDGTVELALPDGTSAIYPLERLTRLYDGLEQLEDLLDEMSLHSSDEENDDSIEIMNEDGTWEQADEEEEEGDWEDESEEGAHMDVEDSGIALSKENSPAPKDERMEVDQGAVDIEIPPALAGPSSAALQIPAADDADDAVWSRFEVLPSAPADHAFYGTIPGQPARNFLARLQKEYRALSSSLPDTILVRAYEDRTDLLRCLIIGPENTPYEDAPFVIDWMLESDFPQTPPKAHFLSWTNGNGRVNPNMYEEGKVCLSILGTWSGEKTETWSARSSLLQVLVSIQGLVLVKEPWFCEPAYERLRGTDEGTVNSRLYSEKAYVLSRGFVRRAIEIPLGGLETEIDWLYRKKGKLAKVIQDARKLIERSQSSVELTDKEKDLAVPRLTTGGVIALRRTLAKLEALA